MKKAIGLAMAVCLLSIGCKKGDSSESTASSAPSCATADELLLKIDSISENVGMQEAFQTALQSLPPAVQESVVNRINAKVATDGKRMRAPEGAPRQWIALLMLSTKSEARAVEDFRYCNGDFDFGNGQRWHWVYSMSNGANGPEMRINSAQVTSGGAVAVATPAEAATPPDAPQAADESAQADGLQNSDYDGEDDTQEPTPAADAAAATAADAAEAAANAVEASERAQELARIADERRQLERERRELTRQREQAAAQREAEATAAREAQARMLREQEAAASRGPTADELYESRRNECPRGFLGSECRNRIKQQVCAGHWSTLPERGYSNCKIQ